MLGIFLSVLLSVSIIKGTDAGGVGVTYGTRGTAMPAPTDVARFLARDTIFDRVRLLDADPATLRAFASTGLAVDVTVPNADVPLLATSLASARRWARSRLAPSVNAGVNVSRVLVGDEAISQANRTLLRSLLPAMQNLHTALAVASPRRRLRGEIKVSTPHSLDILATPPSPSPSSARFRDGYDTAVIKPLLRFLRATGAPFMVNAYPYYGVTTASIDYAAFRLNDGVVDAVTGLVYTNMLDAQLDAVYSAMRRLGFDDVEIVVAETGWPSAGEYWETGAGADIARDYNKNAIRHLGSGVGTPLMPNRTFEVSIFSLFDENLKPGPVSERSFGLYHADMTPVYDAGILTVPQEIVGTKVTPPAPEAVPEGRRWCVPKPAADEVVLQVNIDFVCGQGDIDCGAIRPGGSCYDPNNVQAHAAYAMNLYFQSNGHHGFDCDFSQTGVVTTVDPSYGTCIFT